MSIEAIEDGIKTTARRLTYLFCALLLIRLIFGVVYWISPMTLIGWFEQEGFIFSKVFLFLFECEVYVWRFLFGSEHPMMQDMLAFTQTIFFGGR